MTAKKGRKIMMDDNDLMFGNQFKGKNNKAKTTQTKKKTKRK